MRRRASFTLLELLAVVTLMSVAVGFATLRLDGLGDTGRLRGAAGQIASILRLTQAVARTSGEPRLVEYVQDDASLIVHAPTRTDDSWQWSTGQPYPLAGGVRIDRLLIEGATDSERHDRQVRLRPDGHYLAHAVVLVLHGRYAVLVVRSFEAPRCVMLDHAPQAASFDLLLLELEAVRHAS